MEGESISDRFFNPDIDTGLFVDGMRNRNTKNVTDCYVRLFTKWLSTLRSEKRNIEDIDASQLDAYLAQFILTVRKDGNMPINDLSRQYEPSTLLAIHSCIHRYLVSKNYPHNIKGSDVFKHSREVLGAKMKELKQLGKGNKPHAAQPFTADELCLLAQRNLLGVANAEALLNTMWLNNILHFGLRGRQEHVEMLWGDLELKTDFTGIQYLEFNERATKTRQGATRDVRLFHPKMYATGTEQCPVRVYCEYAKRRPVDLWQPDSRFYLQPISNPKSDIWFSHQPFGKNAIGSIAKRMTAKAGIPTTGKSNHSGRKTTVQTLLHAGIPPTSVMQLTGHKNMQSLNTYAHLSLDQQQNISNILSQHIRPSTSKSASAPVINTIASTVVPRPPSTVISISPQPNFNLNCSLDYADADDDVSQLPDENFNVSLINLPTASHMSLTNFHVTNKSAQIGQYIDNNLVVPPVPQIPPQLGSHLHRYGFLNGSIHGDVHVHFHDHRSDSLPLPKRRRIINNSSDEE